MSLKWSPGCGCCGAVFESCADFTYSLTTGTAFDTGTWNADVPGNVSYVSSEVIEVTNTTIRLNSPTSNTAYAVRVKFNASSGTPSVTIRCVDGMGNPTAYGTATLNTSGGDCEVSVNGGSTTTYCNNADTSVADAAIQVNFTPDYILSAARAFCGGDEIFNQTFYSGHVLIDSPSPSYDENWEIAVTGTVEITEVNFQTATVNYTTSPQTYCDPEELWEEISFVPYVYVEDFQLETRYRGGGSPSYTSEYAVLSMNGSDVDQTGYTWLRFGGNGNANDDLSTPPPDLLKTWTASTGLFTVGRCGVNAFDVSPDTNDSYSYSERDGLLMTGFTQYIKDAPSNGDEYPVPYWRVTFNIKSDCQAFPLPTTADIDLQDVGSQFTITTPDCDHEAFGCARTSSVTWTHG